MTLLKPIPLLRKIFLTCILLLSGTIFLSAQIKAPKANYTSPTANADYSIYVFCDANNSGNVGELEVTAPNGETGYSFTWAKYDAGTSDFTIPVSASDDGILSRASVLEDGGYRVVMDNGTSTKSYFATVINNNNTVPSISFEEKSCAGIKFNSSFKAKDYIYFDLSAGANKTFIPDDSHNRFVLVRGEKAITTAKVSEVESESGISLWDVEAYKGIGQYTFELTDKYNCKWNSEIVAESTYVVKAEFSAKPEEGEAPLKVVFSVDNNKVNATEYEWYLYKKKEELLPGISLEDSLLVDPIFQAPPLDFTYENSGIYGARLIVRNTNGPDDCVDQIFKSEAVKVDTSLLEVPNVFTPNGDDFNEVFKMRKVQSLKKFHAIIFNRWGRIIYEWSNEHEGWDGKVNGKMATPGTYYIVVNAIGRDRPERKYVVKKSFMLLRGK
ncbi:MAG: gliding motility-associated C-terminal domain-containing protein [Marinifilaceae bacterium]